MGELRSRELQLLRHGKLLLSVRSAQWSSFPAGDATEAPEKCILPDTGWGALVAWYAGPTRVVRTPEKRVGQVAVERVNRRQRVVHRSVEPLSPRESAGIDDDIDGYLGDAGVPPRPRGFRWVLRLPVRCPTEPEFWAAVYQGLDQDAPEAVHPRDIAPALDRVLSRLYST
jgi:hypothetical protein